MMKILSVPNVGQEYNLSLPVNGGRETFAVTVKKVEDGWVTFTIAASNSREVLRIEDFNSYTV